MSDVIQTIKSERVRVKFCGITKLEDALYAEALGVDAIGFVFSDASPRSITPSAAKAIIEQLPAFISTVGLFVNEEQAKVREIANELNLSLLQFHGDETAEYCDKINKPYMKAVRVQTQDDILNTQSHYPTARALLFDSFNKRSFGGTGEAFNWELIPKNLVKPFVLAGGLTIDNVKDAIVTIKPYAIDVSSGIESARGIKNQALMSRFMQEVNHA